MRLARQTGRKKRGWVGRLFTQGGGLGGLALGYYLAAPGGAPEAAWQPGDAKELVLVWRTIGSGQGRVWSGVYLEHSARPA